MVNDTSQRQNRKRASAKVVRKLHETGDESGGEQPTRRARSARLSSSARKALILEAAMRFFADNGLSGTIREFANFMGVSSALIFRYFNTKEDLIKAAYETLYVQQIDSEWIKLLSDRSSSIEQRLKAFYRSYIAASDDYRWIRVALATGLSNLPMVKEYLNSFMTPVLDQMAKEIHFSRTGNELDKVDPEERELLWHLHSSLVYFLIRKYVYRSVVTNNTVRVMDRSIHHFLQGFDPPLIDARGD